ncbi:MAG: hypothetical protein J1E84_07250, partial [Muribaculaceae bacterium]|nr:hypothetical protein [Muribaculaceae bacterium]
RVSPESRLPSLRHSQRFFHRASARKAGFQACDKPGRAATKSTPPTTRRMTCMSGVVASLR